MLSFKRIAQSSKRICGLAILFLLSPLPFRTTAGTTPLVWTTERVDDAAKFMSLALDPQGNLHMSYARDAGSIRYAFRDAHLSKWFTMLVADSSMAFTGLTLDAQGNPHICFTPGVMKYAAWDGREWKIQEVDPDSGVIAYSCTVAISADGTPHVTWYHERSSDRSNYLHFKYAVLQEGVWMARTIDLDAQTGKWHSMVLDSEGRPHISYDAFVSGQLKYAYWDGKTWVKHPVDAMGDKSQAGRGMGNSLALDAKGQAHISYYEGMYDGLLKYASQQAGTWKLQTVDSVISNGGWTAYRSSLALDRQGFPHIAYDSGGILKHAYWDGERWQIQIISAKRTTDPYRFCSLVIGPDDTIYVAYRDPLDGSVELAIGRPKSSSENNAAEAKQNH